MLKILVISIIFGAVNLSQSGYYEILGISKQASTQEIRQAYKKLAIKFHPDKNSDTEDQNKFIKITEAYETLKDREKRRNYDLYGSYPSYTKKYDHRSQTEYNNLFYNGLYHEDPNVETLSGRSFYSYLTDGFHFVNFYSPFCPPCQNLVDHWKKLAEIYKDIVKIGAVNCKYHNSFCYNSMRISSYPSLLFYPDGQKGNYVHYRGDRTFEALNQFLMTYIKSRIHVPVVTRLRSDETPIAYILGSQRIDESALTRIAHVLKGLVTLVIVEDDDLRGKLTKDEYTTAVLRYNGKNHEIKSTEEKDVLKDIVSILPIAEPVGPERFKEIRTELRSGSTKPWVLFFSSHGQDRLLFYQMRLSFPDMQFGEVDCSLHRQLCASLGAGAGAGWSSWAALKPGGAYQRGPPHAPPRAFVQHATRATTLHSLSSSEFNRVLSGGDTSTWVLLVVPQTFPSAHIEETFTRASLHFLDTRNMNFGIMSCTATTDELCRHVAGDEPAILIQRGDEQHEYSGQIDEQELLEFVQLVVNSQDLELDEQKVVEILDPSSRQHSWLVSFLPPHCGRPCHALAHEMRLVARKLRPLEFVRVGMLQCKETTTGFCSNIRTPSARLYPIASGQHYTVSLQQLAQAPYIWEWALGLIDDSVQKLSWQTFSRLVISEDLVARNKKPWLVYFHSPRCYRCYEMYADFAMAGIHLHNAVELGKVNCVTDRNLCQHEHITGYPSLRLYLPRNIHQPFSSVITIKPKEYISLLNEIKPLLVKYDDTIDLDLGVRAQGFQVKHDEF